MSEIPPIDSKTNLDNAILTIERQNQQITTLIEQFKQQQAYINKIKKQLDSQTSLAIAQQEANQLAIVLCSRCGRRETNRNTTSGMCWSCYRRSYD